MLVRLQLRPIISRTLATSVAAVKRSLTPEMPSHKRPASSPTQHPRQHKKRSTPSSGTLMTEERVLSLYPTVGVASKHLDSPKNAVSTYCARKNLNKPTISSSSYGSYNGKIHFKTTLTLADPPASITGVGEGTTRSNAEKTAYLSIVLQLAQSGLLDQVLASGYAPQPETVLRDGTALDLQRAKAFVEFYCAKYDLPPPELVPSDLRGTWVVNLSIQDRRLGVGKGHSKKLAISSSYLDAVKYLDNCDLNLWPSFLLDSKKQDKKKEITAQLAPPHWINGSGRLGAKLKGLNHGLSRTQLYSNRPKPIHDDSLSADTGSPSHSSSDSESASAVSLPTGARYRAPNQTFLQNKSQRMKDTLESYMSDPVHADMRKQRHALPVFTRSSELIDLLESQDVTVCMAATGSGKTTQIPQIILDSYIAKGEGSECNVVCTQPRRIAAISVAERVAKERGQVTGDQIGYQVRFDSKLPMNHGSITFCTTGIFLKRMQSALYDSPSSGNGRSMDDVTHLIVDEVHERDVDTDLTLMVLKRLLQDRKARGKPLKLILMSATIDPSLFQSYFEDVNEKPVQVIDVPGRSFPVERHHLEDVLAQLSGEHVGRLSPWLFEERNVVHYLGNEVGPSAIGALRSRGSNNIRAVEPSATRDAGENLDVPSGLVALVVAHVLRGSESGHVLVFLPGWEEITAVQRILLDPQRFPLLGMNLSDTRKYKIHLLHSSIPVAEQQAVFEPAPHGVRRIILATNVAETSVTIPDVVYVVDTGKVKEKRYDPERHMSSLVSAWVGTSNLNQRAGRAGRHRPGQYYSLVSKTRLATLEPYQTVEMKRVDLSDVVMHVKALDFPGMQVEEIFASLIEPPSPERVQAALETLRLVGALDQNEHLTSLGRVLLQLPIEAALGRLVLYGCLFKCLGPTLTLASLMANRDPFLSPVNLRTEAFSMKKSWSPKAFLSDSLAALQAYTVWWEKQSRGNFIEANQFCSENFLSKPTLLMIEKVRTSLLQSLLDAGVVDASAGGRASSAFAKSQFVATSKWKRKITSESEILPELNVNSDSLPILAALIALASQPNFAARTSERVYRTSKDKATLIHPSSVNGIKKERQSAAKREPYEKHIITFTEKVRNVSVASTATNATIFLRDTTRLDVVTYVLFGAHQVLSADPGLICDNWLPVQGNQNILEPVKELKTYLEACMLRVFEGISAANSQRSRERLIQSAFKFAQNDDVSDSDDDDQDDEATPLSQEEIDEIDSLTDDVVEILEMFSEERIASQSRMTSRPSTPVSLKASPGASPALGTLPLSDAETGSSFSQGIRKTLANRSGARTPHPSRPHTPLHKSYTGR
ncbi:uncharacterized protein EI90DRAFT_3152220 [Cantharellus anzutake]|uniref:uncharacterized protein n=1 Tax=Cantharellus anzutake TaxID=1750568 RepID=UPI0019059517|nr:uncharacterized protein EI90DRAFT_3152220 [Cantharellus anzutake]KAF8337571.1 hypothetical protein EI90DRAFT_3152220 [Cantharellus anzutake]